MIMIQSWSSLVRMTKRLWKCESGIVISAELVMVLTLGVLATVAGLSQIAQATVQEYGGMAGALQGLNQSYTTPSFFGCRKGGALASAGGSGFSDSARGGTVGMGGGAGGFSGGGGSDFAGGSSFIVATAAPQVDALLVQTAAPQAVIAQTDAAALVIPQQPQTLVTVQLTGVVPLAAIAIDPNSVQIQGAAAKKACGQKSDASGADKGALTPAPAPAVNKQAAGFQSVSENCDGNCSKP